eukprot:1159332-Pelagomonas_calceolata.AAC.9
MLRILLPPAHPHSFFQIKLETRIPAAFLSGLTALVPNVSGLNLELNLKFKPAQVAHVLLIYRQRPKQLACSTMQLLQALGSTSVRKKEKPCRQSLCRECSHGENTTSIKEKEHQDEKGRVANSLQAGKRSGPSKRICKETGGNYGGKENSPYINQGKGETSALLRGAVSSLHHKAAKTESAIWGMEGYWKHPAPEPGCEEYTCFQ